MTQDEFKSEAKTYRLAQSLLLPEVEIYETESISTINRPSIKEGAAFLLNACSAIGACKRIPLTTNDENSIFKSELGDATLEAVPPFIADEAQPLD